MANILEVCLGDLITKKNLLEGELEQLVNDPNTGPKTKFDKTIDLLKEISDTYNSINLLNTYITKNKNEEK